MIIACGDWHLGYKKANDAAVDRMLNMIEENADLIDILILNGDCVDLWRAKYKEIKKNKTFKHLQHVTNLVRTVYIRGNHDYMTDKIIGNDLNVEYKRIFVHDNICYLHGDQLALLQIESLFAFITHRCNFISRWINATPIKTTVPKTILNRINKFSENNFFEHIVISHYHCPGIYKNIIFTGDSIYHPSYLEITNDSIKIKSI